MKMKQQKRSILPSATNNRFKVTEVIRLGLCDLKHDLLQVCDSNLHVLQHPDLFALNRFNCEMCTASRMTAAQDKDATDCRCSGGSRTGPPGQPGEAASGNLCPVFLRKASWQSHRPGLLAVTTRIARRRDSYVLYHSESMSTDTF